MIVTSNGKDVDGQYSVRLPDGRLQIVSYTSGADGYQAKVEYEGDIQSAASFDGSRRTKNMHQTPAEHQFKSKGNAWIPDPDAADQSVTEASVTDEREVVEPKFI